MIQLNPCDNVYEAQKLFVDVLNEQGPVTLFGNAIMPARLLYCSMPEVFAQKFHAFVADLVARGLANPKAIYWTIWDTLPENEWGVLPDYNLVMRGAELQTQRRASLSCVH